MFEPIFGDYPFDLNIGIKFCQNLVKEENIGYQTMSLSTALFLFEINCKYIFFTMTGVAVGSGWQAWVAFINLGCYYVVGLPLGLVMGLVFDLGVMVCVTSFISLRF